MNKQEAVDILKNAFRHLFFEENLQVGDVNVLLYFPTIGLAIVEPDEDTKLCMSCENLECIQELLIKKNLEATPIYMDVNEDHFCIGDIINDILMEAMFIPTENDIKGRGTN